MRCFPVIASVAKQSTSAHGAKWIASSQGLLAMTGKQLYFMGYMSSQTLRSVAERDASRRIEATAGPSWFSERCHRVARTRAR
jgi:hypothetical protein